MNFMQMNKLQPESPEEQNAIFNIAKSKSRTQPEYCPVTIELRDTSQSDRRGAGFHSFELYTKTDTEGGRVRDTQDVRIVDKFVSFIVHPDYRGLMLHIPSTSLNLDMLASHWDQNVFVIHQEDVEAKVAQMAEQKRSVRSSNEKPVVSVSPLSEEAEIARLEAQIAALKAKMDIENENEEGGTEEYQGEVGQTTTFDERENGVRAEDITINQGEVSVFESNVDENEVSGQVSTQKEPPQKVKSRPTKKLYTPAQKEAARVAVHEKYGDEINTMGKKYYVTPKYRRWLKEELEGVAA